MLVGGGISILVVRAAFLAVRARNVLRRWVIAMAEVELTLDLATFCAAIAWWASGARWARTTALRCAAAATIFHAVRVLVFVLGRLRPFKDFDVRPGQRTRHDETWTWRGVIFAAAMSVLGVLGVLVVWRRLRTAARSLASV